MRICRRNSVYADNLAKELPRIPCLEAAATFWTISRAGRALAELHVNYETASMYFGAKIEHSSRPLSNADYKVEKMRHAKKGGE